MELCSLQVYVYDLNVNKYEPLCEQSGEFNNNCLSGFPLRGQSPPTRAVACQLIADVTVDLLDDWL